MRQAILRGASLEIAMIPNLTTYRRGRLLLVVQEAVYVVTRRWACQRVEALSTAKA